MTTVRFVRGGSQGTGGAGNAGTRALGVDIDGYPGWRAIFVPPRQDGADGNARLSGVVDLDRDMSYNRILEVTPGCVVNMNGFRLFIVNSHESHDTRTGRQRTRDRWRRRGRGR